MPTLEIRIRQQPVPVIRFMVRHALALASALALFGMVACGGHDAAAPLVPTSIVASAGPVALDAIGATASLSAVVKDQNGNTMTGAGVTWTSDASAVAVSASGVVTAVSNGGATITAHSGAAAAMVSVTVTQVPVAPVKVAGDAQSTSVGSAVATPLKVRVQDRLGVRMVSRAVTFTVTQGGGSLTGVSAATDTAGFATAGWILGTSAAQSQRVTVGTTGTTGTAVFSATATAGAPASVVVNVGNGQSAAPSAMVTTPPAVFVSDGFGNPVPGVQVVFAVASGGGSVTGATANTNSIGIAAVGSWTLGPSAGSNTLTATVTGLTPVVFSATGSGLFHIDLRFLNPQPSPSQMAAFQAAATRWQSIVLGDLPDVPVNVPAGFCGVNSPAMNETVDDLVIFVTIDSIDGVNNVLGSAGPCFVRSGGAGLPFVGQMRFDSADIAAMQTNGILQAVVLHEMAHVLGIGTISAWANNLVSRSFPDSAGVDTHFTGANAIAGFNQIGGNTYTHGAKVPVENTQGGAGTRDAHWRESVLANELMTGFVSAGANPLSVLTVRALQDFGYVVDPSQADSFFLTLNARAAGVSAPVFFLGADAIPLP